MIPTCRGTLIGQGFEFNERRDLLCTYRTTIRMGPVRCSKMTINNAKAEEIYGFSGPATQRGRMQAACIYTLT